MELFFRICKNSQEFIHFFLSIPQNCEEITVIHCFELLLKLYRCAISTTIALNHIQLKVLILQLPKFPYRILIYATIFRYLETGIFVLQKHQINVLKGHKPS